MSSKYQRMQAIRDADPTADPMEVGIFEMLDANKEAEQILKNVLALYQRLRDDGILVVVGEDLPLAEVVEVVDPETCRVVCTAVCSKCRQEQQYCECDVEKALEKLKKALKQLWRDDQADKTCNCAPKR